MAAKQTGFGKYLWAARQRLGITQAALSSKIGAGKSYAGNLELGHQRFPRPSYMERFAIVFAEAFDVDPDTVYQEMVDIVKNDAVVGGFSYLPTYRTPFYVKPNLVYIKVEPNLKGAKPVSPEKAKAKGIAGSKPPKPARDLMPDRDEIYGIDQFDKAAEQAIIDSIAKARRTKQRPVTVNVPPLEMPTVIVEGVTIVEGDTVSRITRIVTALSLLTLAGTGVYWTLDKLTLLPG